MIIRSATHLETLIRRYNVKYSNWYLNHDPGVSIVVSIPGNELKDVVSDAMRMLRHAREVEWMWCIPCPDADFNGFKFYAMGALSLPETW